MTHPEELLAGYVDGALSPAERAIVDDHLTGCGLCQGEIQMAIQAHARLGGLAQEPAPAGISAAVGRALNQPSAARTLGSRLPARYRILAVVAAAAVVALVAVVLPGLGRSPDTTGQLAAGNGSQASTKELVPAQAPAGSLGIEVQTIDYTAATAARLMQRTPGPSQVTASDGGFAANQSGTAAAGQTALACLSKAFNGIPGTPVRLISATFQGLPAYIGVYTEGPGAGLPPDTITVRVASATSCTVLTFASSKI
jgi:Putative zinc-finger